MINLVIPQSDASCRVELSYWVVSCTFREYSWRKWYDLIYHIWMRDATAQCVVSRRTESLIQIVRFSRAFIKNLSLQYTCTSHIIWKQVVSYENGHVTHSRCTPNFATSSGLRRSKSDMSPTPSRECITPRYVSSLRSSRNVCVLQCVAVWCSVLQFVAVCCSVCCSVLPCVAVCCSVVQCGAVRCSVLQCVAVCCSVLQCVAVCCSELSIQYECITPACVSSLRSFMNVCVCVMFVRVWCMICVWYVHDMFWACGPLGMPVLRWEWEKQASVTKFHSRKREWACACVRIHVFVRQSTRADARASIFAHVLEQQCLLSRHAFKQMFVRFKLTEARLHTWMYMRHPESGCV